MQKTSNQYVKLKPSIKTTAKVCSFETVHFTSIKFQNESTFLKLKYFLFLQKHVLIIEQIYVLFRSLCWIFVSIFSYFSCLHVIKNGFLRQSRNPVVKYSSFLAAIWINVYFRLISFHKSSSMSFTSWLSLFLLLTYNNVGVCVYVCEREWRNIYNSLIM